jgi:GNAT superfamily N-acetyltransferase
MKIRDYRDADAPAVGRLIAETFRKYNLSHADPEEQERLLGPFRHAFSEDPKHREAVCAILRSPMLYVAEESDEIVGVLRGRENVLASLFVHGDHHGKGVGRKLVEHFERESRSQGVTWIRVAATLFAVPFYQALGYKKTTGVRPCPTFDGTDFMQQPMRKVLT